MFSPFIFNAGGGRSTTLLFVFYLTPPLSFLVLFALIKYLKICDIIISIGFLAMFLYFPPSCALRIIICIFNLLPSILNELPGFYMFHFCMFFICTLNSDLATSDNERF